MSFPWTLVLSVLLGLGLMFTLAAPGLEGIVADVDHVVGALILTVAALAMGEPMRMIRYINVLLGLGVVLAPSLVGSAAAYAPIIHLLLGLAVVALALPCGRIRER